MHSSFKVLACILLCTQLGWSQEKVKDTTHTRNEFSKTFFEIAYTQPVSYGDNFINKGYDLSGTIDVGITTAFYYNTTLHFDVNIASGDVTRPDLVGNIRSAIFTRISGGIGYPLDITDKLQFIPSLHIGYLKIGQNGFDGEFRDDGVFLAPEVAFYYAVFGWIDISLGARNYFDFIRIDAPSDVRSFFNNAQSVYPYIGLRFLLDKV
ncbi:hypothetical protein SAMN06265376_1011093 [Dokdonia pacifica]|uniref:Outer membrane protein beta-barrel domain-containing protein n=1 Tax=Dokdonia pacifica TaxID=1627892 RepID=A0A238WKC6_9FLAO|nr:hypothetical protein SAMN06265376_1011093 [Dokdonia pacifica]